MTVQGKFRHLPEEKNVSALSKCLFKALSCLTIYSMLVSSQIKEGGYKEGLELICPECGGKMVFHDYYERHANMGKHGGRSFCFLVWSIL